MSASVPSSAPPAAPPPASPGIAEKRAGIGLMVTVLAILVGHAALLWVLMTVREDKVVAPPEVRTISAEMISIAPPAPTPPAPKVQPVVHPPKPRPTPVLRPRPVLTPRPNAPTIPVEPPQATPAPPTAPAEPAPPVQSAPAAPAASSGPKSVRHLACDIATPTYPPLSTRRGEAGTVVLTITVDTRGSIESAVVKHSSGFPRLDEAARATVLAGHCSPYLDGGQAVRAVTDATYKFTLPE
ncbi:MAG: energy transducer TonB [Janthinobacterium lividum]